MIVPRLTRVALLAVAAVAASGCATFTDNDLVAEVGDDRMTAADFEALAGGLGLEAGAEVPDRVPRQTVDEVISVYVIDSLLRQDLAGLDVEVADGDAAEGAAPFAALQADYTAAVQAFLEVPADKLLDERTRGVYAAGPEVSGVTCAQHILVATEAEAAEARDEVIDGAPFGDVAAAVSTDTGSAMNAGQLGCLGTEEFRAQFIPEFVDAALASPVGELTQPIESQFGYHVIRLVPLDELSSEERGAIAPSLRFATLPDRFGVSIDPRYGEWLDTGRLVPVS